MDNITKIDPNFAVETSLNIDNIKFHNIRQAPFSIHGLIYENGKYRRMPESVAKKVSEKVYISHTICAGGRVRFTTNSSYVAIKAVMDASWKMPVVPVTGTGGFDLYVGKPAEYYNTFVPPADVSKGYESVIHFETKQLRQITIHFPLYSKLTELYIGLEDGAVLKEAPKYKYEKPIVFYGSSITQGGCASRPGNIYENILARKLQTDYWNLGFSGSAMAENEMAEYIKGLDMSVFVYDYDHNAPDLAHLEATHQKMFQTIRNSNPKLPILILSRPKYKLTEMEQRRFEIIRKTYTDALAAGDKHTYFIEGPSLMKYAKSDGTVDDCHPNDLGFHSIARVLAPHLKQLLK